MLVCMVYGLGGLDWSPAGQLDHLELFAGCGSVTIGEIQDGFTPLKR